MNSRRRARPWPYPRHDDFASELRTLAGRYFRKRGYPVQERYPFILAQLEDWPSNIILPEVAAFIKEERKRREERGAGYPLHKYVHHGLSSQAMLFNLLGPLILRNDFEPVASVLEERGISWPQDNVASAFEIEDRSVFNEDSGQPTSIDAVIASDSGPSLFVEAKLVERGFGGCSVCRRGDCEGRNPAGDPSLCYLHHMGRKYWDLMLRHGLAQEWDKSPVCPFGNYYQFFRELLFALDKEGLLVLLHDKRNPSFSCHGPSGVRGVLPFLVSMLPLHLQSRVVGITTQQLLEAVKTTGRHDDWTGEFVEKYGMLP